MVVKKIPVGMLTEAVYTALSEFGVIKSIKMQLIKLWQKAVVKFEQLDYTNLVTIKWLILIGKDTVYVARVDSDKELWDVRDHHRALLYILPVETNAHNI
ncbi:hypothetical protein G9A89_012527 [Geosiphon pyriformis]|nr:hypothetical protein G9A89_012527 [Geosiphon pyriformis]